MHVKINYIMTIIVKYTEIFIKLYPDDLYYFPAITLISDNDSFVQSNL